MTAVRAIGRGARLIVFVLCLGVLACDEESTAAPITVDGAEVIHSLTRNDPHGAAAVNPSVVAPLSFRGVQPFLGVDGRSLPLEPGQTVGERLRSAGYAVEELAFAEVLDVPTAIQICRRLCRGGVIHLFSQGPKIR